MPLSNIHERFRVSCLLRAAEVAASWRATHVVSLIDPALGAEHVPAIRNAEPTPFRGTAPDLAPQHHSRAWWCKGLLTAGPLRSDHQPTLCP